jgi:hypothetical protein
LGWINTENPITLLLQPARQAFNLKIQIRRVLIGRFELSCRRTTIAEGVSWQVKVRERICDPASYARMKAYTRSCMEELTASRTPRLSERARFFRAATGAGMLCDFCC